VRCILELAGREMHDVKDFLLADIHRKTGGREHD
jgi:hypothetical protein